MKKREVNLKEVLYDLKKFLDESDGAKVTATVKDVFGLKGYLVGITLQKEDFEPEDGDWKLNGDDL
jgi:hypothetical protein